MDKFLKLVEDYQDRRAPRQIRKKRESIVRETNRYTLHKSRMNRDRKNDKGNSSAQ